MISTYIWWSCSSYLWATVSCHDLAMAQLTLQHRTLRFWTGTTSTTGTSACALPVLLAVLSNLIVHQSSLVLQQTIGSCGQAAASGHQPPSRAAALDLLMAAASCSPARQDKPQTGNWWCRTGSRTQPNPASMKPAHCLMVLMMSLVQACLQWHDNQDRMLLPISEDS